MLNEVSFHACTITNYFDTHKVDSREPSLFSISQTQQYLATQMELTQME